MLMACYWTIGKETQKVILVDILLMYSLYCYLIHTATISCLKIFFKYIAMGHIALLSNFKKEQDIR